MLELRTIREAIRDGDPVDDRAFDAVYPPGLRRASPVYWTPIDAAARAATLLATEPGARILDVGSGVGKFCIVAASLGVAQVSGIEHRARLVGIAEEAAKRFEVDVAFKRGTLDDCDPGVVDGVYFFNPFLENLCPPEDWLDTTVELGPERFVRDIARAEAFLRAARVGTKVVTYCGFGGRIPRGYERVFAENRGGLLELWVKQQRSR